MEDTIPPSIQQQQEQITKKKSPRPSPTGFSYVEEGVYTNIVEEIEAMGGDPSFLMEVVPPLFNDIPTDHVTTTSSVVEADASSIAWEWDGVEENDAYFDE
jgi:hypothetical protein